MKPGI